MNPLNFNNYELDDTDKKVCDILRHQSDILHLYNIVESAQGNCCGSQLVSGNSDNVTCYGTDKCYRFKFACMRKDYTRDELRCLALQAGNLEKRVRCECVMTLIKQKECLDVCDRLVVFLLANKRIHAKLFSAVSLAVQMQGQCKEYCTYFKYWDQCCKYYCKRYDGRLLRHLYNMCSSQLKGFGGNNTALTRCV